MSSEELKRPLGLRKRIIGAVVLVGLAVILLPAFLERVPQDVYVSKLPQPPSLPENKALTPADFATPIPNAEQNKTGAATAWVVQLGRFPVRAKAQQLVKQLQQSGYPAYVHRIVDNKTTVYEVFVGPETDQDKLKLWVKQLQKQNIKGQIVVYNPISN